MGLLRNNKLITHPYIIIMPRDAREWTRLITALNDLDLEWGLGETGTSTAAMTSTNKPGANNKTQPDKWFAIVDTNGLTYYLPGYLP